MDVFRNHLFKQTSRFTKPGRSSQNAPNLSNVILHPDSGPCDGKTTSAGAGLGLEGDKIKSRHRFVGNTNILSVKQTFPTRT